MAIPWLRYAFGVSAKEHLLAIGYTQARNVFQVFCEYEFRQREALLESLIRRVFQKCMYAVLHIVDGYARAEVLQLPDNRRVIADDLDSAVERSVAGSPSQ